MQVESVAERPTTVLLSRAASPGSVPSFDIEAAKAWPPLNLRELWAHRELIYFLVWRDIKVRYKQTVLGTGWALIQPSVHYAAV